MDENEKNQFWINKKAKIEILKDGKRLVFTASVVEMDASHITFLDREGMVYSFNRDLVQEMQVLGDTNG